MPSGDTPQLKQVPYDPNSIADQDPVSKKEGDELFSQGSEVKGDSDD